MQQGERRAMYRETAPAPDRAPRPVLGLPGHRRQPAGLRDHRPRHPHLRPHLRRQRGGHRAGGGRLRPGALPLLRPRGPGGRPLRAPGHHLRRDPPHLRRLPPLRPGGRLRAPPALPLHRRNRLHRRHHRDADRGRGRGHPREPGADDGHLPGLLRLRRGSRAEHRGAGGRHAGAAGAVLRVRRVDPGGGGVGADAAPRDEAPVRPPAGAGGAGGGHRRAARPSPARRAGAAPEASPGSGGWCASC